MCDFREPPIAVYDKRDKTYKVVTFKGAIGWKESYLPKEEGIYQTLTSGSGYIYYDGKENYWPEQKNSPYLFLFKENANIFIFFIDNETISIEPDLPLIYR